MLCATVNICLFFGCFTDIEYILQIIAVHSDNIRNISPHDETYMCVCVCFMRVRVFAANVAHPL